jgi:tetratricopeptide (TPR) repeat protein
MLLVVVAVLAARHWNANRPRNRYLRGREALAAGDRRTALRESQFLIGTNDFEPHGHLLAGLLLVGGGRPADALEELQHAAWDDETAVEALTAAAECYYALGQSQKVIETARTALSRNENAIEARRWLAAAWYDLGAMVNAVSELERISAEDPGDPRSEFLLGLIAKDDEQFASAVEHYRKALLRGITGDTRETLLRDLADSLLKLSRFEEALDVLKEAERSPRVLTSESEALQGLRRQEEAYERVREAIELDPAYFPARLQQGSLLLFDQRVAEAATSLEEAVRLSPHSSRAHFQLSQAYQRLGKTEEAAEQVKRMQQCQALEIEFSELHGKASERPADADLRFRIGQLAQKLGKPELARMWFLAVLALQPDHAGARQALNAAVSPVHGFDRNE